MKCIGIDYGKKRIGIALSDDSGTLAFPKKILNNDGKGAVIREVAEYCNAELVKMIVIGLSLDREGEENAIMKEARIFGQGLEQVTELPVVYEWEGYSSALAKNTLRPEGVARGNVARKVKVVQEKVDAHAAQIILQSYLDKQSS